jgi:hypothetical protein
MLMGSSERARVQLVTTVEELPWEFNGDQGKWTFVIDSLIGGLGYAGVVKWLAMHDTLDEAVLAAAKMRDGMVAT